LEAAVTMLSKEVAGAASLVEGYEFIGGIFDLSLTAVGVQPIF